MIGSLWITTLRKLPTSRDSRKALPRSSAGLAWKTSAGVR
jgi:hypothetical protein